MMTNRFAEAIRAGYDAWMHDFCPSCSASFVGPPRPSGTALQCEHCGHFFRVPGRSVARPPAFSVVPWRLSAEAARLRLLMLIALSMWLGSPFLGLGVTFATAGIGGLLLPLFILSSMGGVIWLFVLFFLYWSKSQSSKSG